MKENICPICGEGTLRKEIIEEKFEYKGQSTIIPNYIIYHCDVCKETIVDNNTLKQSGKILKNFQRKVDGLLSGEEIREIRKKLGLTQEEMAEMLGGGLKSFARYESGLICQSRAMDNLLRILDRYPDISHLIFKEIPHQLKEREKIGVITQNRKVIYLEDYQSYKKKCASEQDLFDIKSDGVMYGT